MSYQFAGSIAVLLYCCTALYQGARIIQNQPISQRPLQVVMALALVFHGTATYLRIFAAHGLDLTLFSGSVGIFFVVNLILYISSFSRPVLTLYLPMSLLAILVIGGSLLVSPQPASHPGVPVTIGSHIVSSVLAYSLLILAVIQALLLSLQNWMLRHRHLGKNLRRLPPLEVTETLLFQFIWAGFVMLTISLVTGVLFLENIFTQHLAHKMFFSCLAWLFFAVLLWGHHVRGWRGNTAVKWTLWGFVTLMVGFWGSKLVLEFFLTQ